jgi:hypothetical protein
MGSTASPCFAATRSPLEGSLGHSRPKSLEAPVISHVLVLVSVMVMFFLLWRVVQGRLAGPFVTGFLGCLRVRPRRGDGGRRPG